MAGVLYIVATPIGNLEDITLRALRVLKEADLIAAEDTRHAQKLLSHYDIHTPLTSYHEHNERTKAPALVERLLGGESVALVSDAGTPAISDPGYRLVVAAVAAGVRLTPIPGAAALTAALSAAALPTDRFVFEGFLPAKKTEKRQKLMALGDEKRTLIFYEAPHRLKDTLADIQQTLGDRELLIARELTKIHEEFLRGTVSELIRQIGDHTVKGEVTIIMRGAAPESRVSDQSLLAEIRRLQGQGLGVKQIAALLGERHSLSKRAVYRLALAARESD
jgi:16S rRNA (cytidine1402-2'-O)-methyltransferase